MTADPSLDDDSDDGDAFDVYGNETPNNAEERKIDCIGDIEAKLKQNNLRYVKKKLLIDTESFEHMTSKDFRDLLKEFKQKYKVDKDGQYLYPHRKRLMVMLDRRGYAENECEHLFLYEPPANCRNMPIDQVPEWGLNASKTCLLPNMDYGDGWKAENPTTVDFSMQKLEEANIGAASHCKGRLLTFSFQVFEEDIIRSYLYWNGQSINFIPQDIKSILTRIFNMKWSRPGKKTMSDELDNENFIKETDSEKGADGLIKRISNKIKNRQFVNFRVCCSQ